MLTILRQYVDGEFQVTEYDNGYVIRVPKQEEVTANIYDIKKQKSKELQQNYYSSFTNFQSSALGMLKTYPIDKEAQENLRDYQNRLIADPSKDSFYFKTIEDGTLILHTRQQFLKLMDDAEMFKVNQTIKINDLINQVTVATTSAEVNAIVW